MVFSHGLGGSRNAYSHLLGSLSSHGVVIIAPDHRDGSSPIQFIRETSGSKRRRVDYQSFPHKPSQEAEAGRNKQLQIRLWELGMIHEAILKMDTDGDSINNLCAKGGSLSKHDRMSTIAMFRDQLDVHRPGSISWVGHSFGATTMVQFVKSTFWRPSSAPHQGEPYLRDYEPLFTPTEDSQIVRQITPSSPISLLDLWCLPLRGQTTRWLWDKPMPCHCPSGPGGKALLAVLSEAFFKWQGNLKYSKRVLSENPASNSYKQSKPGPRFFYPVASAHLSQSDFGVLFPWVTKKVFKAENPERTLRLNVRAILQVMREVGQEVADTSKIDIEEGGVTGETEVPVNGVDGWQDWKILATDGRVKGWVSVSTNVNDLGDSTKGIADPKATPTEAVMEGEVRDGDHRRQNI
ncbi:MAG: hypothetical protein M1827_006173 [Pycnora praestabilis]|nr:MAG: hypothetical protein M1827_006173 [Pycnora praestabilis]